MRKTFVMALIALLVMLAFSSCDGILTEDNGDGLVTLSVNTGKTEGISRTITDPLAKQEANYVEVIFKDTVGGGYYRANGYQGAKLKVKVPAGTYNNTNTLILIGKKSDGTLLAFGTSDATGVTVGGASDPLDPTIEFTATSIVTKISADTGTNFVIDTTNITNPLFPIATINSGVFYDDDPNTACFQVPTGVSIAAGIKATLNLTGANFAGLGDRIIINPTSPATTIDPVTITPVGDPASVITLTAAGATPKSGDMVDGKIEFAFNTTTESRCSITFDIPVVGYDGVTVVGNGTAPLTWHIRGGTEPGYDFKGTFNDTVPLRVTTNPTSAKFGIIANPGH
jgi:hypothetical protein